MPTGVERGAAGSTEVASCFGERSALALVDSGFVGPVDCLCWIAGSGRLGEVVGQVAGGDRPAALACGLRGHHRPGHEFQSG